MVKRLRNTVSILLVIVFLLPITIKFFDGLFHHHHHCICITKDLTQLHKSHKKCIIQSFELSVFSFQKHIFQKHKAEYNNRVSISYISNYFSGKFNYSFLLRAPPCRNNI